MPHTSIPRWLPAAALLAWASVASHAQPLDLVRDGAPQATIVMDQAPTRAAQFAAAELNWHIEQITGTRLPVVCGPQAVSGTRVLVGHSPATQKLGLQNDDFAAQEYLIRFLPDTLVLVGRDKQDDRQPLDYADPATFPGKLDDQATSYAVYDFLERFCGVRWYLPTDVGMVCPQANSLPQNHPSHVKRPSVTEPPTGSGTGSKDGSQNHPSHVGRPSGTGSKTLSIQGTEVRRSPAMKYREMYRAADMPASLSDVPGPRLPERDGRLFMHRQRLLGIQAYACNHSFYGYYDQHLKTSPEWFAKGYDQDLRATAKALTGSGRKYRAYYPNLCYTNPDLIQHVIQRARAYFDTGKLQPSEVGAGDFFSLVPMDSSGQDKFCRCPACQALLHQEPPCKQWRDHAFFWDDKASDYIFGFVNKVARGVAQTHPGKYLTVVAYHQNYYPPTKEPLESNVAVTFCIHAALRPVPAMDRAVRGLLDKWDEEPLGLSTATGPGRPAQGRADQASAAPPRPTQQRPKYLWLYFHRPGPANPFFPGFMAHHLVRQMQDYHRRGFRGIFVEPAYFPRDARQEGGAGRAPIVTLLELYLAFKLADDPTLDGNKLIDEFFPLYYGSAAEPMRKLYEAIEHTYCDPATYASSPATYYGYQTPQIAWKKLGTRARMLEFEALMKEAAQAARTPMEKKRVALFEQSIWNRMQTASRQTAQGTSAQMD